MDRNGIPHAVPDERGHAIVTRVPTEYVLIERVNASRPVYHRQKHGDRSMWNEGEGVSYREWVTDWYEKAACGRKTTICAALIQRDRADLFARPCQHCFKEELAA